MKTYKVNANINGSITFEVKAKNLKDAQKQVDNLLSDISVKEAIGKYKNSITFDTRFKEEKIMER